MTKALIIVESPAKARTITRYLGSDFEVESSIGHIRDLPSTAAEIPPNLKGAAWTRLGVDVERDFEPLYVVPDAKKAQVRRLKTKLKDASELYLATDEDREGEAIAWHLVEVLRPSCPVKRMVFHEITKGAISDALDATRSIDQRLVAAQETRRILDRLVGYEVSPILWRKVRPKLSAGRVQSVAVRLVVDREQARMRFVAANYWTLEAMLASAGEQFKARLAELAGQRVATGKDFDSTTGALKRGRVLLLDEAMARSLHGALQGADFAVSEVQEKPFTTRPYPPFMTSTLQQEAGRKLRFNAQKTMRVAQSLYENGHITYMRTDSTTLSREATAAARRQVEDLYGGSYLPDKPRAYASKSKLAQEAHEAIRPAGNAFRTPDSLRGSLSNDELRLYELIWKRTLASQMRDAEGVRTTVRVAATAGEHGEAVFTSTGKRFNFQGFLRAYVESSDDPSSESADSESLLPRLTVGQQVDVASLDPVGKSTQPPSRFTEAGLIAELESRGIGRPSTFATIIQTIQDRGYVFHKGPALVPTFTAFAVTRLLEQHLADLVDYDFTARMEDELDSIASGEREPRPWLREFYYGGSTNGGEGLQVMKVGLRDLVASSVESIDPREVARIPIGTTDGGEDVVVRVGRYGPYLEIGGGGRTSLPEDLPPDELTVDKALELAAQVDRGDRHLGEHPETGQPVHVKTGRFGPYVQLGESESAEKGGGKRARKAKMASLWPGMTPEDVNLEQAVMLLSFPREVGVHPTTGTVITAQNGRYGPYLKMGDESRSLPDHSRLATVTLDEAVEIFAQPKGGRGKGPAQSLAELGVHPSTGAPITVKDGRFGAFVTDGEINASIPKGTDPASVTLDDALRLLEARAEKLKTTGGAKPKRGRKGKTTTTKRSTTRKK